MPFRGYFPEVADIEQAEEAGQGRFLVGKLQLASFAAGEVERADLHFVDFEAKMVHADSP